MKKELIFWSIVSAVSTVISAIHPEANFNLMILVAVLSLVLWLCGYVFEQSMAPDPWSESPVPKQKKWIACLIFYGLNICLSLYIDLGYWFAAIGAVIIIGGFPDDKKLPTRKEWFRIFEIAIIFAIVAFLVAFCSMLLIFCLHNAGFFLYLALDVFVYLW